MSSSVIKRYQNNANPM